MADKPEEKFKRGDPVRLTRGSPTMKVFQVEERPLSDPPILVHCQWFVGTKLETGSFPPESLELIADEEKGKK